MNTNLHLSDEQVQKAQAANYRFAKKNVELEKSKLWKDKRQKQLTQNEKYRDAGLKKFLLRNNLAITKQEKRRC